MNLAKRVNLSGEDPYSLQESPENTLSFWGNKVEPRKSFVFIFNIQGERFFYIIRKAGK